MAKKEVVAAAAAEPVADVGEVKSVPDYMTIAALKRSKLAQWVERHAEIDKLIKELEAERKELKANGVDLFVRNDIKSVMVNGRPVTRIDGKSVTYPLQKWIAAGVTDKQIAAAKTEKPWTSLKVGKLPGEGDEDE